MVHYRVCTELIYPYYKLLAIHARETLGKVTNDGQKTFLFSLPFHYFQDMDPLR